mmetsp:Transcript_10557/g.22414  ORF Transcript_10557/g.22414 Transcript_10557/m.22414 type:complete len:290 (+) Transcript_10557:722-1591(+)
MSAAVLPGCQSAHCGLSPNPNQLRQCLHPDTCPLQLRRGPSRHPQLVVLPVHHSQCVTSTKTSLYPSHRSILRNVHRHPDANLDFAPMFAGGSAHRVVYPIQGAAQQPVRKDLAFEQVMLEGAASPSLLVLAPEVQLMCHQRAELWRVVLEPLLELLDCCGVHENVESHVPNANGVVPLAPTLQQRFPTLQGITQRHTTPVVDTINHAIWRCHMGAVAQDKSEPVGQLGFRAVRGRTDLNIPHARHQLDRSESPSQRGLPVHIHHPSRLHKRLVFILCLLQRPLDPLLQ